MALVYPLSSRSEKVIFGIAFFVLSLHLLAFVGVTANPYLQSDAWFFLSEFLIPYYEGNFEFKDLYVLRSSADHLQPMHRIMLFANASLFGLDFRLEGILGAVFTVLIAWLLCLHFKVSHFVTERKPVEIGLGLIALVMTVYSLNSTVLYTWSLVTIGYMSLFLVIGFFVYLSNLIVKDTGHDVVLVAIGLLMLFVADDVGVLAMIVAIVIVLVEYFVRRKSCVWKYLLLIVSMIIVYQLFKKNIVVHLAETKGGFDLSNSINYYLEHLSSLHKIISAPFADSFFHGMHLRKSPEIKNEVTIVLGLSILLLHIYSWYVFFKYKSYEKSYLPLMLMLFSYALIAGIMLYRVPGFGYEYLHQPRYVRAYQIGLWGSVLALLSVYYTKYVNGDDLSVARRFLYLGVLVTVVVQIHLAGEAWKGRKYILKWQHQHAQNILYFSEDKELGVPCTKAKSVYPICKMNASRREKLIKFMHDEQLNVFSERVRNDYFYK